MGVFCTQCGAGSQQGDLFCRQCGSPHDSVPGNPTSRVDTVQRLPSEVESPLTTRTMSFAGVVPAGSFAAPPGLLPALISCPVCSMPLPSGSHQCAHCGSSRELVPTGACFRCGAGNPSTQRYCGRCGGLLVTNALSSERVSISALPVMGSMLLPGLGQFMNGETVKGFMLLALSLLMISRQADFLSPAYILITAIAMIDAALGQARRDRRSFA